MSARSQTDTCPKSCPLRFGSCLNNSRRPSEGPLANERAHNLEIILSICTTDAIPKRRPVRAFSTTVREPGTYPRSVAQSIGGAKSPGRTIPYLSFRNFWSPSVKSGTSSCQVSTLHRIFISTDFTAAITRNHASRRSGRRSSWITQKLAPRAWAASTLRMS